MKDEALITIVGNFLKIEMRYKRYLMYLNFPCMMYFFNIPKSYSITFINFIGVFIAGVLEIPINFCVKAFSVL